MNQKWLKNEWEKRKKRRELLKIMLKKRLSKVKDDPPVKRLLTDIEAEDGLNTVIDRIVDNALRIEKKLGRQLTFREFPE